MVTLCCPPVVDFPVQEAQRIMARALEEENKLAITMARKYAGNKPKSFYVTTKNAKGRVDYTPNNNFDTTDNVVIYSQAGADINNLVIGGGQRVGMGTMSKRSFMMIDPLVEDPEFEHDAVVSEQLEQALLVSIQQQASEGIIPPADLARIMELVANNDYELPEAVDKMQKEAQERQATEVAAMAPEAQPGLGLPGMGAESMAAAAGAAEEEVDLGQLLGAL